MIVFPIFLAQNKSVRRERRKVRCIGRGLLRMAYGFVDIPCF